MSSTTETLPDWAVSFLGALQAGRTVAASARIAGVTAAAPYHRRKRDPAFAAMWDKIRPVEPARAGHPGPKRRHSRDRVGRFLDELAASSNVSAAATASGLSLGAAYALRRTDPEFAKRWYAALAEGYDNLEMELLAHLRGGSDAAGASDGARKFDTAAALRCLAAHRDSVAREKGRAALADEVVTIASINARIDALRARRRQGDAAIRRARAENAKRETGHDAA